MSPINRRRPVLIGVVVILILICLISGLGLYLLLPRRYRAAETALESASGGAINILLIGKDARALNPALDRGGTARIPREKVAHSDLIIICHFNLPKNRLNLVAVPRDLLVAVPGVTRAESKTDFTRMEKITHTYALGGERLLRRTLEELLGIKIQRFIAFDFDSFRMAFRLLRSVIGPVTVGGVRLDDPDQALKFARQRNRLRYDDLDRCRNALNLIKTIARRLWSLADTRLADILLDRLFAIIGPDTDLKPAEIKQLLSRLRHQGFRPDGIQCAVLVSEGRPVTLDRYAMTLSCYLPIYPEIEKQIARYLFDRDDISALDFMTQEHYAWPDYLTENYDLLPAYHSDTLMRQRLLQRILKLELKEPARESR